MVTTKPANGMARNGVVLSLIRPKPQRVLVGCTSTAMIYSGTPPMLS